MKVRDAFATINGDDSTIEMPSNGVEIVSDDGRPLFCIYLQDDGSIDIDTGSMCKHAGKMLGTGMIIWPRASNAIKICRTEYE